MIKLTEILLRNIKKNKEVHQMNFVDLIKPKEIEVEKESDVPFILNINIEIGGGSNDIYERELERDRQFNKFLLGM